MGELLQAIIIDDDPSCHKTLGSLLQENHKDILIVGNARNVEEGKRLIAQEKPTLIFLDIELSDGLGFDVLEEFPDPQFRVIFITAYNEYALTAIRFEALDFLEKPLDEDEIAVALDKARKDRNRIIDQEQLAYLKENFHRAQHKHLPRRIAIPNQSEIHFLKVEQIVWLQADETYTWFHLKDEENPVLSTSNLGTFVRKFKPYEVFQQVHRSRMLNLTYVKKVNKGQRVAILDGNKEIGIARRYWDTFKAAMEKF
ncbi:MAG: LytTR family DNA-binding domain-containing protein [Bacteroidota bacterium]